MEIGWARSTSRPFNYCALQRPGNQHPLRTRACRALTLLPYSSRFLELCRCDEFDPVQVDSQHKRLGRSVPTLELVVLRIACSVTWTALEQSLWSPLVAALLSSSAHSLCRKNPT
ncbi:hypothetical protein NL676_032981 [Syzygium grande]|nr:hypothetical protein NL676_032981 [Syzygium grande]